MQFQRVHQHLGIDASIARDILQLSADDPIQLDDLFIVAIFESLVDLRAEDMIEIHEFAG